MRKKVLNIVIVFLVLLTAVTVSAGGYIIGDEDVLQISVWGNQELSVQVPVRPDGMISVPLLGDVKATGATPMELKSILERGFSKFVKAPVVSVIVTSVNSFKVYVLGEGIARAAAGAGTAGAGGAQSSGVITLKKNTSLFQLLAQLGSLRDADLRNAYIIRQGNKLPVDFVALVTRGDNSQDIQLAPNDMIYIPDNFGQRIRVIGQVRTPTTMPYTEGMTALDAVLSAGGFTEFANQNSVVIVRKDGNTSKNIEVRLKDVMNGNLKKNVPLQPGDIVTVSSGIF